MWILLNTLVFITITAFSVNPQPITEVEIQARQYAKFGGAVTLKCGFDGSDFTIQYISWTKIYAGAKRRVFVYEFSPLPFYNQSYNDLKGRAFLQYELGSGAMLDSISAPFSPSSHASGHQLENRNEGGPSEKLLPAEGGAEGTYEQKTQRYLTKRATAATSSSRSTFTAYEPSGEPGIDPNKEDIQQFLREMRKTSTTNRPLDTRTLGSSEDASGSGSISLDEASFDRLKSWNNFVLLTINPVLLIDEAYYECLIKPIGGPAVADVKKMDVRVAPSSPVIDDTKEYFEEGENTTLYCRANVGKPAGELLWFRRRASDTDFKPIQHGTIRRETTPLFNKTVYAVSSLELQLFAEDDAAVYRCAAKSNWPDELRHYDVALDVKFPVRSASIDYQQDQETYICHANGNPRPKYTWKLIQPSGEVVILTRRSYLRMENLRRKNYYGITKSGFHRFMCTASNTFHAADIRVDMETDIWISVTSPTSGTTMPPLRTPAPPSKYDAFNAEHPKLDPGRQMGYYSGQAPNRFQGFGRQNHIPSSVFGENVENFENMDGRPTKNSIDFRYSNRKNIDNADIGMVENINSLTNKNDELSSSSSSNDDLNRIHSRDNMERANPIKKEVTIGGDPVFTNSGSEDFDSGSVERFQGGIENRLTSVSNEAFANGNTNGHPGEAVIKSGRFSSDKIDIDGGDGSAARSPQRLLTRSKRPLNTGARIGFRNHFLGNTVNSNSGSDDNDHTRDRSPLHLSPQHQHRRLPTNRLSGVKTGSFSDKKNPDNLHYPTEIVNAEYTPNNSKKPIHGFYGYKSEKRHYNLPNDYPHGYSSSKNLPLYQKRNIYRAQTSGEQQHENTGKAPRFIDPLHSIPPELERSARRISPDPEQPQQVSPSYRLYNRQMLGLQAADQEYKAHSNFKQHFLDEESPNSRGQDTLEPFPDVTKQPIYMSQEREGAPRGDKGFPPLSSLFSDTPSSDNSIQGAYPSNENQPPSRNHVQQARYPLPRPEGPDGMGTDDTRNAFGRDQVYPKPPPRGFVAPSGDTAFPDHNRNRALPDHGSPTFITENDLPLLPETNGPPVIPGRIDNIPGELDTSGVTDYDHEHPFDLGRSEPVQNQDGNIQPFDQEEAVNADLNEFDAFPDVGPDPRSSHSLAENNPSTYAPSESSEYDHSLFPPESNDLPEFPEQNRIPGDEVDTNLPEGNSAEGYDQGIMQGSVGNEEIGSNQENIANFPNPKVPKDAGFATANRKIKVKVPKIKHGKVRLTGNSDFDCSRRSDGVIESGCRAFYKCVSGKTFFVECDYNYVLNIDIGDCDRRENAPAPCGVKQDCMEKDDGRYADVERDCTYYYTCHDGYFMGTNKCNPGLVFNEDRQICDWSDSAEESCKKSKSYTERYGR